MPEPEVKKEPAPLVDETPAPPEKPLWEGSLSAKQEIVAPDGHVVLSAEDIKASKSK